MNESACLHESPPVVCNPSKAWLSGLPGSLTMETENQRVITVLERKAVSKWP